MKINLQTLAQYRAEIARKNETPLAKLCAELGVQVRAIRGGVARDAHKWDHYLWSVTLSRNGADFYSGPFRRGMAHAHQERRMSSSGTNRAPVIPNPPHVSDVMHSLLSDMSLASGTFEDFCGNLGYNTDSRKALETYLACQDSGHALRKAFTAPEIRELENAGTDY